MIMLAYSRFHISTVKQCKLQHEDGFQLSARLNTNSHVIAAISGFVRPTEIVY